MTRAGESDAHGVARARWTRRAAIVKASRPELAAGALVGAYNLLVHRLLPKPNAAADVAAFLGSRLAGGPWLRAEPPPRAWKVASPP